MPQLFAAAFVIAAMAGLAAAPRFVSVWESSDVARLDFAGKKVAAIAEAQDPKSLQAFVAELVKGAVSEMRREKFVN